MRTRRILTLLALLAPASALSFLAAADALAQAAPKAASAKTSPVAPRQEQIQAIINEAYNKFKGETRGKNADYIPELAKVDSKLFGIAVVSTDNQSVAVGDTKNRTSCVGEACRSSRDRLPSRVVQSVTTPKSLPK